MQSLTRDKDLFQISVGGREGKPWRMNTVLFFAQLLLGSTIDFGDVFFNSQTHNVRFISIKNLSSQSLPFQVKKKIVKKPFQQCSFV